MQSSSIFFFSRVETSSPLSVLSDSEKNDFNRNVPNGVVTYLLFATREIVEISRFTFSEMSFRIIGFKRVSSPVRKYSDWCFIMQFMVISNVDWRCISASMNHWALSILLFTKVDASLLVLSLFREYCVSISIYSLLTFNSGMFREFRLISSFP